MNMYKSLIYSHLTKFQRSVKTKLNQRKEASLALDTCYCETVYSGRERKRIIRDMINTKKRYGFSYNEYMLYHFNSLNLKERLAFISDKERIISLKKLNPSENSIIFNEKILTYFIFRKFYQREVIKFTCRKQEENKFIEFYSKHTEFIIKPCNGYCGWQVQKIHSEEGKGSQLFSEFCRQYTNGFIVEELIYACPELAAFHPQSLNTLRVPVIKYDDGSEVIHPFIRFGRGDSIVDNAGAGGIFCTLDSVGCITASVDEKGNHYEEHPDSHLRLTGYKVPRYDEATAMAKELMEVIPNNRYLGFDLALTDKGWIVVEVNFLGQFVWQMATHEGFRKEYMEIQRKCGFEPIYGFDSLS